jgi:hypothetical protein
MALNLHEVITSYQRAEDKAKWRTANDDGWRLMNWARSGETKNPDPNEVRIELPERPRRRK